jgi:hypothetical protein
VNNGLRDIGTVGVGRLVVWCVAEISSLEMYIFRENGWSGRAWPVRPPRTCGPNASISSVADLSQYL